MLSLHSLIPQVLEQTLLNLQDLILPMDVLASQSWSCDTLRLDTCGNELTRTSEGGVLRVSLINKVGTSYSQSRFFWV